MDYIMQNSRAIRRISLFFSLSFLAACPAAAWYTGEWGQVLSGWQQILFSPCPLVTDYFQLGNLAAALLNAAACGLACTAIMWISRAECRASTMAGFFLVIAHCFYGLNFLNMWSPVLGIFLFCRIMKIHFSDNLDMAMFSTAFGPFVSELLFRYTQGDHFVPGQPTVTWLGLFLIILLTAFLGLAIPAMLPGAQRMHKGFNLYNGGLAFGLLGLFLYSFMYKTMGRTQAPAMELSNEVYASFGNSYAGFATGYFLIVFGICLAAGWYLNGKTFRGYRELLKSSGHQSNFFQKFGTAKVLLNLGFYGLMMTAWFNLVIILTEGAGYTGATMGVTLAAMTFVGIGQHPKNVWPILAGYVLLFLFVAAVCCLTGDAIPWTLSTQGYMNGAAFATGLCPLTGKYGRKVGVLAGFFCAVMCTSTSALHGGFVLYNGGLTAGITALILVPCLEYYYPERKVQ